MKVVPVQDHGDAVVLGHEADVLRPGDGAEHRGFLPRVLDPLARQEGSSAIGELNNNTSPAANTQHLLLLYVQHNKDNNYTRQQSIVVQRKHSSSHLNYNRGIDVASCLQHRVDGGGGGAVEGGEGVAILLAVGHQLHQVVSCDHSCWHESF